ncbi:hypothetical protein J2850_003194 [Azospirillum picis]|uniref:Uncharacterized protein n=1 Tax=Azospirillum picis TaxID=488438 RepID=A0ABU0MLC8_9PROT|nr:hypothetical protein [Azospirillum picis]MDQ0534280.1 hypothetical protein [Azospirillum picis]
MPTTPTRIEARTGPPARRFRVEVLALGEREPRKGYPRVVASVGKAPPQYPGPGDDWDEED